MTFPLDLILALWALFIFIVALWECRHPQPGGQTMTSPTPINSNQLSRTPLTDPAGTFCDAVNSNITPNSGATVFRIVNTDTAAHTVTFDSIPTEDGLALADLVVTIPSSTTQWAAGFDEETFGAQLTYLASSALIKVTIFEP